MRVVLYSYIYIYIYVCVYTYVLCDESAAQGGKIGEGGRGRKVHERGMQAEVGTNVESFNEFE